MALLGVKTHAVKLTTEELKVFLAMVYLHFRIQCLHLYYCKY